VPPPYVPPIDYVSIELRPCSVPASLRSVALSPLELSVYDEGLQFHAPDDEFGQQYSFHVDVQSNCI
jgi:hypothetical protein